MPSPQVLVVDDSKTIRTQLKKYLGMDGYEVRVAATAVEAIREIKDRCPQLLVLDINMPEIDGYAVCAELQRLGPPISELPIVFLTSVEAHALELLGTAMGAYLRKPVAESVLRETVARLLKKRGSSTPVPVSPDSSPAVPDPTSTSTWMAHQ